MNIIFKIVLVFLNLICINNLAAENEQLKEKILKLETKDFKKKINIIEKISEIDTDYSLHTLKSILEGKLFIRKSDKKILLVNIVDRQYKIYDFFFKVFCF